MACYRRGQRRSHGPNEVICQLIEAIRHRPCRGQLLIVASPKHFGSGAVRNARRGVISQHTRRHAHAATAVSPRLDGRRDRRCASRCAATLPPNLLPSSTNGAARLHPARGLASVRRDELSAEMPRPMVVPAPASPTSWWCRTNWPRPRCRSISRCTPSLRITSWTSAPKRKSSAGCPGDERRDAGRNRDDRAGLRLGSEAISTRARRDGDHYVIDGAKTFITNGFTGNLLIVAAPVARVARGVAVRIGDREPARLSCGPPA